MDRILFNVKPFNRLWFKDCFHMSLIPAIDFINGNADFFMYNQMYNYVFSENYLSINTIEFDNLYSILDNYKIRYEVKVNQIDIISYLINNLSNSKLTIVGIDNYYESIRRDCFLKKHNGHSVLVCGVNFSKELFYIIEQPFTYSFKYSLQELSFIDMEKCYLSFVQNHAKKEFYCNKIYNSCLYNNEIPLSVTLDTKKIGQPDNLFDKNIYKHNLKNNFKLLEKGIESLKIFSDNYKNIYDNCSSENKNSMEIIKNLNCIINAKNVEIYIHNKMSLLSDMQKNNGITIAELWSQIRTLLSKYMYSHKRNESHLFQIRENFINIINSEEIILKFLINMI